MEVKIYLCVLLLQAVICSVWCQQTTASMMMTTTIQEEIIENDVTMSMAPSQAPVEPSPTGNNMTKGDDTDGGKDMNGGDSDEDDDDETKEDDEDSDSLSGGAIAGIIIGVILGLVLIVIVVYFVISKFCGEGGNAQAAPAKKSDVRYTEVEKGEKAADKADKVAEEENTTEAEVKA